MGPGMVATVRDGNERLREGKLRRRPSNKIIHHKKTKRLNNFQSQG